MRRRLIVLGIASVALVAAAFIPVGGAPSVAIDASRRAPSMDLSKFSDARPRSPLRMLFIHHSSGGQLLADPGPEKATADSIFDSHPNGGGLRGLLAAHGYEVHEASYGSAVGDETDLFDWAPKFSSQMDAVLRVDKNDDLLPDDRRHQIVVFKSCYPNNRFVGSGEPPGDAAGPELTVANAKATLGALLPEFRKRPSVLFVYVTPPPLARSRPDPAWKYLVKRALGKPRSADVEADQGRWARELDSWVTSQGGWLKGYAEQNVVVFDYYDMLTNDGASNHAHFPTGDGTDSHPSQAGNRRVAEAFVPFLNRAVRRAGLEPP